MRYVSIAVCLLLVAPFAGAAPDTRPVAVFWVGEGLSTSSPSVDIEAVEKAYDGRGYRALHADALPPESLRRLLVSDRAAHPRAYSPGSVIPLVLHGGPRESDITGAALVAAFLDGIGEWARGEVLRSVCFTGIPCRDADLSGSPFSGRVTRIVIRADDSPPRVAVRETPEARILEELGDLLVRATVIGQAEKQRNGWHSSGPLGALESSARGGRAPSREALGGLRVPLLVPDNYLLSLGGVGIGPGSLPEDSDGALLKKLRSK